MDPQKFPIEFNTVADTSGAEATQKAIRDTEAAAAAASDAQKQRDDEARARFEEERERDNQEYERKRKQQERDRNEADPQETARRTAAATEAINTRTRVEALQTLVQGLGEATRKMREFEEDLRDVNPELADMAVKAADATDALSRIGQGALQGFAAGGPVGAGVAAVGSALMYMVEGLVASNRAEKEFEESLRRTNAETNRAREEAIKRAEALEVSLDATRAAADTEEAFNEALDAGGDALDKSNAALRERLELLARQSKDQSEIIRLEEDLERKRIAASTMSSEEKANATNASREREAQRIATLEDETRAQERAAQEQAAAAAREQAMEAGKKMAQMVTLKDHVLSDKEREEIQSTIKGLRTGGMGAVDAQIRRGELQEKLNLDKWAKDQLPGVQNSEDVEKGIRAHEATARKGWEQEAAARRELERIDSEQAQAERVRGFESRGAAIDREREQRSGRRRDLEERGRETEDLSRDIAGRIASEAGAAAGKVKTDVGREMLEAIKSAFADGVLSDSERNELASAFKAINASKEQELVGTLRDLLTAYQSTQAELKSIREAVKGLRDR